uniref:Uncharacterized protein n=1 Tax=viral metagenome TaxID=1070528 RepID=A0A6C0H0S8_9ZZZZ
MGLLEQLRLLRLNTPLMVFFHQVMVLEMLQINLQKIKGKMG